MFWNRTYTGDKWELRRWGYIRHLSEFGLLGYTAILYLRKRKTGRHKVVRVGNCCWIYDSKWEVNDAIFKKTGIEIRDGKALMAKS